MRELISEDEFLTRAAKVPLQVIDWDLAKQKNVEVLMRRDDLIDEYLSGNKFYKLFYNLHAAKEAGHKKILSFGGAYSNHLYALAAAGRDFGFQTVGVIRGERPAVLSATLQDAENFGMQLQFITRTEYREKNSAELKSQLESFHGDFYSIPEGGANDDGVRGTQVIGSSLRQQLNLDYTAVCVACGTGNTLAGIALGLGINAVSSAKAIGFSVLKGEGDLGRHIRTKTHTYELNNWRLISGYHAGGYGKKLPPALIDFNRDFEQQTNVKLDPVYTLKMCWGVSQLLEQNYFPRGSSLVLIHTGGLQGRRGFNL